MTTPQSTRILRKTANGDQHSPPPCSSVGLLTFVDEIEKWGRFMAAVGHGLRLFYGLRVDPTGDQAVEWARLTRRFIQQGHSKDTAGDLAAKQLFSDYRTHFYKAEGDTIDTLLRLAEQK